MADTVQSVKVDQTFRVCPVCGYQDGFHSMFEKTEAGDEYSWRFICPSCHKIFDIGLTVPLQGGA